MEEIKEDKRRKSQLSHKRALKQSLFMGLLFAFLLFFVFIFVQHTEDLFDINQQTIYGLFIRFIANVFIFYLLYEYCFWVFRKEWNFYKKLRVGIFGIFGLSVIISLIFSMLLLQITQLWQDGLENVFIFANLIKDILASFIVFLSTLSTSSLIENQELQIKNQALQIRNQELIIENVRSRYAVLKNQLKPHFMFNSLNTLEGIIDENNEKARNYLQNLSFLFRYSIQEEEITTLQDELRFAKSYAYLMKIRYGKSLSIEYAIDEKYNFYYTMPFCLQLLLENAIKHNVISDKYPLRISIETTDNQTIKVCNAIQPKLDAGTSKGVGLTNLGNRYRLMFEEEVIITKNGDFTVEIPLIKELTKKKKTSKKTLRHSELVSESHSLHGIAGDPESSSGRNDEAHTRHSELVSESHSLQEIAGDPESSSGRNDGVAEKVKRKNEHKLLKNQI